MNEPFNLFGHKLPDLDPGSLISETEDDEDYEYEDLEIPPHLHLSKTQVVTVLTLAGIGAFTVFYVAVKLVNKL